MGKYVLIESRAAFDSPDSEHLYELAGELARKGHETTLFLIQNGVLPARKGSRYSGMLARLAETRVRVIADRFSLRERAILSPIEEVSQADIDTLVDRILGPGTKTIWH